MVLAEDGPLGIVDDVIASETALPAFVVVSTGRRLRRRYPVVPWSLIRTVDRSRRRVYVRGRRTSLAKLSEALPIVL
jgi:hypothetical protein